MNVSEKGKDFGNIKIINLDYSLDHHKFYIYLFGKVTLCWFPEFLLLSLLRSLHKSLKADFCVLFISCSLEK